MWHKDIPDDVIVICLTRYSPFQNIEINFAVERKENQNCQTPTPNAVVSSMCCSLYTVFRWRRTRMRQSIWWRRNLISLDIWNRRHCSKFNCGDQVTIDVELDDAYLSAMVFWLAYWHFNWHNLVCGWKFVDSPDHVFPTGPVSSEQKRRDCVELNVKEPCRLLLMFYVAYQSIALINGPTSLYGALITSKWYCVQPKIEQLFGGDSKPVVRIPHVPVTCNFCAIVNLHLGMFLNRIVIVYTDKTAH